MGDAITNDKKAPNKTKKKPGARVHDSVKAQA